MLSSDELEHLRSVADRYATLLNEDFESGIRRAETHAAGTEYWIDWPPGRALNVLARLAESEKREQALREVLTEAREYVEREWGGTGEGNAVLNRMDHLLDTTPPATVGSVSVKRAKEGVRQ